MTIARAVAPFQLDEDVAWRLIIALRERQRRGGVVNEPCALKLDEAGSLSEVDATEGWISVKPSARVSWRPLAPVLPRAAMLFELYLPLCLGEDANAWAVAHLGQSLDGRIATETGDSRYVTGPENIRHLHRLRALADAVLVGRHTVAADDPRLTTRLVPGENPVRVILDPGRRLADHYRVFQDRDAQTVVLCSERAARERGAPGFAEVAVVPEGDAGRFASRAILVALESLGLRRLFIEGGGVTVSQFLEQRCLHRLHVTIAPIILGSGRQGLQLSTLFSLKNALRPLARRFSLGEDVLFDCEVGAAPWSTH